jgi:DNA-binding response OmpR family regulator
MDHAWPFRHDPEHGAQVWWVPMQEPLRPVFCLLIEDNPLVGLDLAEALDASGFFVAGPFTSGHAAYDWLARFTPDVAVVDLSLTDGSCVEVIRELQGRAIPFLIHSGCKPSQSPLDMATEVPWLEKPVSIAAVAAALQELVCVSGVPD